MIPGPRAWILGVVQVPSRAGAFSVHFIELPLEVDADKVAAAYDKGVLTLRVSKADSTARPRQVTITTN